MNLLPVLCVLCLLFLLIPFTETSGSNDGTKIGDILKKGKAYSAEVFRKLSKMLKPNSASSSTGHNVHPEAGPSSSNSGNKFAKLRRSNSAPLIRTPNWASSSSSGVKDHTGLRVLMVAPNEFKSHYALNKKLALLLLEETEWVQEVYVIIPTGDGVGLVRDKDFEGHPEIGKRLHIEYFYNEKRLDIGKRAVFNDDFKAKHGNGGGEKKPKQKGAFFGFRTASKGSSSKKYAENLKKFDARINTVVEDDGPKDAWSKRKPRNLLGSNQNFMLGLSKNFELVKAMWQRNFDVGIADVWDYAVFHFIFFSNVKHIVATSAQPIQSIYYDFMHFSVEMKHNPELWTATKKNANFDSSETGGRIPNGGSNDNFEFQHQLSIAEAKFLLLHLNKKATKICKAYGFANTCPSYEQLFDSAKYFFVNTQQQLDFRPTRTWPSKVVFFGGITLPPATGASLTRIDQEKSSGEALMASKSKKGGLIVVSFGTLIKVGTMDKEIFDCLLTAFKNLQDYEFFWKVDKVKKPGVELDDATTHRLEQMEAAGNIRPVAWFRQMDMLANERTTLFISHCGLNSVLEAAFQGTPLLCIPLTADQFYNAFAMQWRQTAIVVDKDQLVDKEKTPEQKLDYFEGKLNEALNENKHKHLKSRMGKLKTQLNQLNPTPSQAFLDKMRTFWH